MLKYLSLIVLFAAASGLSAAVQVSNGGLVNSDGCYAKLTGPGDVCPKEQFDVHCVINHDSGKSTTDPANYPVTVSGSPGATVSPSHIDTCPADVQLHVTAGAPGNLVVSVGNVSITIVILTDVAGDWTVIRDPHPKPPAPPGGAYNETTLNYLLNDGRSAFDTYQGNIYSIYFLDANPDDWKPSSKGTPCPDGEYSEEITKSGSIGAGLEFHGFTISAEISKSASVTLHLGPEHGKRFRAYAVFPAEHFYDNRNWTRHVNASGLIPAEDQVIDHRQNVDIGVGYLAGQDLHIEAACCPADEH
jgi:hypothetical protein